jgi:hypothetical protein
MDDFQVDSSEFDKLAVDVSFFPQDAMGFFRQAAEVTARNVKDTARENATGMAHAPAFPYSITYDFVGDSHGGGALGAFVGGRGGYDFAVEIGPDKDLPQGDLGNLIEYGSVNNPPQGIMHGALQAHEADFEKGVDRAVNEAMKAIGL